MLVVKTEVDRQQSLERAFHVVAIPQRKVAQDQVESGTERRLLGHDVLQRGHRVVELTQFHERYRDVLHYLRSTVQRQLMSRDGRLRERHAQKCTVVTLNIITSSNKDI